ncbi:hypothetical protein KAR91_51355 [Candidatus Pacearchaeota archaeon]|nr:hypothetical protein [Candidatus Pacearchaeota archaeon]
MNEIRIEITGGTNGGTSTIAYLIEQALASNGIGFSYKENDREPLERSLTFSLNQRKRLAHLKKNAQVELSTKQISRTELSTIK